MNALLQAALDALEAMKAEFRALDLPYGSKAYAQGNEVSQALRAALAEPQPEPVACTWCCGIGKFADHLCRFCAGKGKGSVFAAPQAQQPLKERPDFIAGYTAGLADGKICAKRDAQRKPMTDDQIRELVEECGLPWRQGFVPLYPGDTTNRYAVLVREVEGMYNSEAP